MAKTRVNPKFIPDLLHTSVQIEVIRTDKLGKNVKKIMTFGEWKVMKKQPCCVYRAFQLKHSQYKLEK